MSDFHSFRVNELGRTGIPITLHKKRKVQVAVKDSEGHAISGASVQLVQLLRNQELADDSLVLGRSQVHWNLRTKSKDWPHAFELAQANSNVKGQATLSCIDANRRIGLIVKAKGFTQSMTTAIQLPAPGTSIEVKLERSASITGTVDFGNQQDRFLREPNTEPSSTTQKLQVAVRHPGGKIKSRDGGRSEGYDIQPDGSFTIDNLGPGRWELLLHWWRPINARSSRGTLAEPPLATVDLARGQKLKLDLDATAALPATITGTVTREGKVLPDTLVSLTRRFHTEKGVLETETGLARVTTDRHGRFETAGLLGGDYLIRVISTNSSGNPEASRTSNWISLRPGGSFDQTFDVSSRSVQLRLTDREGAAIRSRHVTVLCDEFCQSWTLKTDSEGKIEFRDAGGVAYRVLLLAPKTVTSSRDSWEKVNTRKSNASATFSVPPGSGQHKATATLR